MEPPFPKLFVGIQVPLDVGEALLKFRESLPDRCLGLKWAEILDLHITLRFLGRLDNQVNASIREQLSNVQASELTLLIRGGGVFEDVGVLFADIVATPDLLRLQRAVDKVASNNGVPCSEHTYRPHISLAHVKKKELLTNPEGRADFKNLAGELERYWQKVPTRKFAANEMVLFESVSGHYKQLVRFRLGQE